MQKIIGLILLVIGSSAFAMASFTPEIDPTAAGSGIALISGALLVYRGRRK
jgi:hypothetical protein